MARQEPDVLIVGAGPVGLTAAAVFQAQGVSYRLVEKRAEHAKWSKATSIHTRTVEGLALLGLLPSVRRRVTRYVILAGGLCFCFFRLQLTLAQFEASGEYLSKFDVFAGAREKASLSIALPELLPQTRVYRQLLSMPQFVAEQCGAEALQPRPDGSSPVERGVECIEVKQATKGGAA